MLEKEVMEQLFRSHYGVMYRLARCILHDDEESKDVVSDVFARLLDSGRVPDSGNMSGWLLVCVRNRCYDIISHRQVLDRMMHLYPLETAPDLTPVADDTARVEAILQYAADNFTPQTGRVFRMRFCDGRQYKEIAADLGISIPAVYKHLSKALQMIRQQFKRDDYDGD